ncbi:MAG: hypothetical protein R3E39_29920 [Anaerolineae bacterium]
MTAQITNGCSVCWGNDTKTIILIELHGNWNWHHIESVTEDYLKLMNSVEHRVHLIFHPVDNKFRLPTNALSRIPSLIEMTHPREDQTVLVAHSPLIKGILNIVGRVHGLQEAIAKYHFAKTLAEAYDILEKYDMEQKQPV